MDVVTGTVFEVGPVFKLLFVDIQPIASIDVRAQYTRKILGLTPLILNSGKQRGVYITLMALPS